MKNGLKGPKKPIISQISTKKYMDTYFGRRSMKIGLKKYTSQKEVPSSTPAVLRCLKPEL